MILVLLIEFRFPKVPPPIRRSSFDPSLGGLFFQASAQVPYESLGAKPDQLLISVKVPCPIAGSGSCQPHTCAASLRDAGPQF